jgi:hypothetical protein
MKSLLLLVTALLVYRSISFGQIKLQEGFETSDATHLPAGWSKWNQAAFPIDPLGEWFVQDTARYVPGVDSTARRSVAHASLKAAQVSWYAGIDTNTNAYGEADTWLVSKRIRNIGANDSLIFWAIGGNGGTAGTYYRDTLEVWMDTQDSLPVNITYQLSLLTWDNTNSRYGVFKRYAFPLGLAVGQDLFVAFRYHTNVSIDGYAVFVDDVLVKGPLTSVAQERELSKPVQPKHNNRMVSSFEISYWNYDLQHDWSGNCDSRRFGNGTRHLQDNVGCIALSERRVCVSNTGWNRNSNAQNGFFTLSKRHQSFVRA